MKYVYLCLVFMASPLLADCMSDCQKKSDECHKNLYQIKNLDLGGDPCQSDYLNCTMKCSGVGVQGKY